MQLWVGPAIVAAIVSGLVSAIGWFVASWQAGRLEQRRRDEKVGDFQIALRAEIASDLLNMQVADRAKFLERVTAEYAADPAYTPMVPRLATNAVFAVVLREVHILPVVVIGPVIDYARLRQTLEQFVDDMRSNAFRRLPPARQLAMYADYISTFDRLQTLAEIAVGSLDKSLSSSGADPSNPLSAAAPAGSELAVGPEKDEP